MNQTPSFRRSCFVFAAAALLMGAGCSKSENTKSPDVVQDIKDTAKDVATTVKNVSVETWDRIKDATYDQRSQFSASMNAMARGIDDAYADLKSKASAPDNASSQRSAAAADYDAARADLKVKLAALDTATADTWAEAKAKSAAAWQRVQAAYEKLKE